MENKDAVLEIKTANVSYTLPAAEINIDDVSKLMGSQVELKDIKVSVSIAEPTADTVKVVQDTANKGNYQLVVKPVGFTITCTSGDKTVAVSKFNGYVDTAMAYSLITGYDSASYGPNDTITREQAMVIIARAMKLTGLSVSLTDSEKSTLISKYTDGVTVSSYAKESAAVCLKTGIVAGTSASTISPKANVTRAEVAIMVQRLLQKSGLI